MCDVPRIRDLQTSDLDDVLAINSAGQPGVSRLDAGMATALISSAAVV
jgi:predicted GNAT superfamily acetyltransferase